MNNKTLVKDTTVKILSVVFAILLWFYVITEQNPVIEKTISIPVQLINQDYLQRNNMIIMDSIDGYKLSVDIRAKNKILDSIKESNITAFADLSLANVEGENRIPIVINGIPAGVESYKPSLNVIKVNLERRVSVTHPVIVNMIGEPSLGLAAMKALVDPADIIISGPASYVGGVQSVWVDVNITGATSDLNKNLSIRLLSKDGGEVTNVDVDTRRVNVFVPIGNTKLVPVEYDVAGELAAGRILKNMYLYPKEILIAGRQDVLDRISYIKTERLDMSGITESVDKEVGLKMPLDIELVNKEEKVRINIDIEEIITKTVDISGIEVKHLSDNLIYQPFSQNVKVTVKGAKSLVDNIRYAVKLYVDLKNANEGTNTVDIMWEKNLEIDILEVFPTKLDIEVKRREMPIINQ